MNVSESTDVNELLEWFLNLEESLQTEATALFAAIRLADRAHDRLSAGLSGERVRRAWPARRDAHLMRAYDALMQHVRILLNGVDPFWIQDERALQSAQVLATVLAQWEEARRS